MINFTRAFDTAWERTHIILFRPFDGTKWFFIGFNAFLVLLAEGGVAINRSSPFSSQNSHFNYSYHSFPALLRDLKQMVAEMGTLTTSAWLALYIIAAVVYVIVWLALNWVGCRGEFMFLDNIVRNRAAVAWPWQHYARQGNRWFLFHLGLTAISLGLLVASGGAFLGANWSWINGERSPVGNEIGMLIGDLLVSAAVWIVFTAALFLLRSFVIPIYFKQRLGLGASLLAGARLLAVDPVSIGLYVLISAVLSLAGGLLVVLVVCVVCCLICWLACIPLLGTMLLSFVVCQLSLPVLVFYRCFQLDCLAQFGPEYDVWTVDVPAKRKL